MDAPGVSTVERGALQDGRHAACHRPTWRLSGQRCRLRCLPDGPHCPSLGSLRHPGVAFSAENARARGLTGELTASVQSLEPLAGAAQAADSSASTSNLVEKVI